MKEMVPSVVSGKKRHTTSLEESSQSNETEKSNRKPISDGPAPVSRHESCAFFAFGLSLWGAQKQSFQMHLLLLKVGPCLGTRGPCLGTRKAG